MTNIAEIQKLAVQIAEETRKQKALEAQLATLDTALAAATDEDKKKELEAEKVKLAETLEKQKAVRAEMLKQAGAAVAAAKAAEQQTAQGPMYPQGLVVKFGKRTATITRAVKNGQGEWFYNIDLLAGEFLELGDGEYQLTESEMRSKVQEEVGVVQPGQAFAVGMSVTRHGVGGVIEQVTRDASGQFSYQVQGWPRAVLQSEFLGILTRS